MLREEVRREAEAAELRIRKHVRETPLDFSPRLSHLVGCTVYLKLETFQILGSFKIRGALNKVLSLSDDERSRGIVAASTGNHGAAVARAANTLGTSAIVFVPTGASDAKLELMRDLGADVRVFGEDSGKTETHARAYAMANHMPYVSPYNDPLIIAGQGTIGLEIERQTDRVDAVIAPLGGGGLIAGVAGTLKAGPTGAALKAIAASPENSCVMAASVRAGRVVQMDSLPTLSDATAGGIEPDAITYPLCRELVDEFVLVSEEEIRQAVRLVIAQHHVLVEGAAGAAVAALLRLREQLAGSTVAVILSGANISAETLGRLL